MNRLIALGDIHGCIHALDAVLEAIQPNESDTLVILGDFVDSGRDTNAVIERLLRLQEQCEMIVLRGNHEEMLLDALGNEQLRNQWLELGGIYTLQSYGFMADMGAIPDEHLAFIEQTRDYYETDTHLFVHACYRSDLPMSALEDYVLRWEMLEEPYPPPQHSGKTVVVGHTEQKNCEVLDFGYLVCLDTYCREYGWLTAMNVLTGELWQANRWGALREDHESVENQRVAASYLKHSLISE